MAASPKRTPALAVPPRRSGVPTKSRGVAASAEVAVIPRSTPAGDLGEASPAGTTYTLTMPAGQKMLSLNSRYHWAERRRRTEQLKNDACQTARSLKIPRLERVTIVVEYQPPDRRRRDADNAATASGKPCIDGLVLAGVLEDDDSAHVLSVTYRIGEIYRLGRLILHVTEVPS